MRVLKRFSPLAPLSLLVLATGCITSPPGAYGATAEATQESTLVPCPNGMIEDAEDNNNQITDVDGRNGYWFTFVDEVGSTVAPKGDFTMSPGGPNGSKYAAKMTGKMAPAGDSVYAGMGFNLTNPKGPYDASKAVGVSFWAKGPGKIRFKTPDVNTIPEGDRCEDCYNDFGVDLYLTDQWVKYTVPFEKLSQQPGWGDRAPSVTEEMIFAIQWQFGTKNAEYEIWVDEIQFMCKGSGS